MPPPAQIAPLIDLTGVWLLLFKGCLIAIPPVLGAVVPWAVWVTKTLFDLKSGSAVQESKQPGILKRETGVDDALKQIQKDIGELKSMVAMLQSKS